MTRSQPVSSKGRGRRSGAPESTQESTRERLLIEATRLFAERGIEATSIRDLAQAADVNVAAVHYHFGGKEELYEAVMERALAPVGTLRVRLSEALEAARAAGTRDAAVSALRSCVFAFMSHLFDDGHSTWAGLLMQREAIEATPALQRCIEEFVGPVWETSLALLETLRADLGRDTLRLIASSIVGQCLYFQREQPIVRFSFGIAQIDDAFVRRAAEHIVRFSLAALDEMENQ